MVLRQSAGTESMLLKLDTLFSGQMSPVNYMPPFEPILQ
jgi:hypothetical protein